jgi:ferredoxin
VQLHAVADMERCIGSGTCAFLAPHVFDVSAEGLVVVRGPFDADDQQAEEAIRGCPTEALRIVDGDR